MFVVWYIIAVFGAFVLQTNAFFFRVGSGLRVDFALFVVMYFSLFWGGTRALLIGFLTGLLQDALSSELLGLNALSKMATAFVLYSLGRNMQVNSVIAHVFFTGLTILVDTVTRLVVMGVLQSHTFTVTTMVSTFVQQTLLSLALLPVVFIGLHALARSLRIDHNAGQGDAAV